MCTMSASDHLQGKLFYTPTELATNYHPIDTERFGHADDEAMWAHKLSESKKPRGTGWGSGVYDGLKAGKIEDTVTTSSPAGPGSPPEYSRTQNNLNEGHHRVAAGLQLEREGHEVYLPTLHTDYR
jgi:coproporphyrinogen III oxidase